MAGARHAVAVTTLTVSAASRQDGGPAVVPANAASLNPGRW